MAGTGASVAAAALFTTITSMSDGFNIGQQISLQLTDANGNSYDMGRITRFTSTPKGTDIESKTIVLNGYVDVKRSREGWTGEVTVDRTNGKWDALEAAQEAAFHAGQPQMYFTLKATILNDDTTTDVFQFIRCEFHMTAGGNWALDEKVEQTVSFTAAQRRKLQ